MSKPQRRHWRLEVEWQDSQILQAGWLPVSDALKARRTVTCTSLGFVLADDKRGVVLAGSVNGGNATGVIAIPARQITKRRRLR